MEKIVIPKFEKHCKCGCGSSIVWKPYFKYYGIPNYVNGHNCRGKKQSSDHISNRISGIDYEKRKETYLKNLGVKHPMQSEKIKRKRELTWIKKYGVDNPAKIISNRDRQSKVMREGRAAFMNSFIKNPSKPQIELYNMVKEIYPDAKSNYTCLSYSIDIVIPSLRIAIEYDGSYWHKDKEKDLKRQLKIEQEGWKFFRFEDYIPTKVELESLNEMP